MTKQNFFKRNKNIINRVVRGHLAKNKIGIVHGKRATNAQLPRDLNRKTNDWDVFVKFPEARARQLEAKLDKKFRGDFFRVKEGMGSPGVKVFKVKDNINDETVVDFATINRKVPFITKRGVRFATLRDQAEKARKTLRERTAPFRREKDLDLLRRIKKARSGRRVK